MSEYPKCHAWQNGQGITVDFGHHDWKETDQGEGICYIANTNIRALHAVLTEKIAEMDAKRWVVKEAFGGSSFQVESPRHALRATPFFAGTPEQNKADAEEYAAKLNAREGLA